MAAVARLGVRKAGFELGVNDYKRFRIQEGQPVRAILVIFIRIPAGEQVVIQAHLRVYRVRCRYPVQRGAHPASVRSAAPACLRVIGAAQLYNFSAFVLYYFLALDEVAVAQSHLASRREAIKPSWWVFHEVLTLDVQFARERNFACACGLVLWVVHGIEPVGFTFRIVGNDDLEGV